jgi:6-phosphogluconolactonase
VNEETPFPWAQTHIFWGDERMVSPTHPESNFGQAESLLLTRVPVPPTQVYRISGEVDPVTAAGAYADILQEVAGSEGALWPRFDLVLLGLGSDGHTASLFPGSASPLPDQQPTLAVSANYEDRPAGRVTLTPPAINSARHILFLVTGTEKAEALTQVLNGPDDPVRWPAQRIQPEKGTLIWFADEAAARLLPR